MPEYVDEIPIQLFIHPVPFNKLFIEKIKRNHTLKKPIGGVWTSSLIDEGSYFSSWEMFSKEHVSKYFDCYYNGYLDNYQILIPQFKPKIYYISTYDHFHELYEEFSLFKNFKGKEHAYINWKKFFLKYDAFYLTHMMNGFVKTSDNKILTFNGWDCESIIWNSDKFKAIPLLKYLEISY